MAQCVDSLCGAKFAVMVVIFSISANGINFTSSAQQAVDTTVYVVGAYRKIFTIFIFLFRSLFVKLICTCVVVFHYKTNSIHNVVYNVNSLHYSLAAV